MRFGGGLDGRFATKFFGSLVVYFPFCSLTLNFSPITTAKLVQLLTDPQKVAYLQLELAAVVNCGENFVKATYKLESDGPVVFKCYEIISTLTASIHTTLRKMKAM